METFKEKIDNIFQLKIPFDTVYTSVFLVRVDSWFILVDTGATDSDVTEYICHALNEFGVSQNNLKYVVLTHCHGDHSGGLKMLKRIFPNSKVITENIKLTSDIEIVSLLGHTLDCVGVLDLRTKTLISGDGIQGFGVDKFKTTLQDVKEYISTLNAILNNENVENVLFSHAYEPWKADFAFGREKVRYCVEESLEYALKEFKK